MRAKRWGLCLAVLLPLYAGASAAAPIGYASAFEGLYQIDLATGQGVKVGDYGTNVVDVEGLTLLADGTLVGISDARKALYRLSLGSGRAAFVATLDAVLRDFAALDLGLAAGCNGTLYVSSDEQRKLWRLSGDGSAVLISDLPAAISGLAFRNGELFGLAIDSPGLSAGQGLWRIDPTTGAATLIGNFSTPRPVRDAGLDFSSDGRLWATFDYNPPASGQIADYSDVAELNPQTGAVISRTTVTGIPAGSDFEGLAVSPPVCQPGGVAPPPGRPVPAGSPWSWLVLGLGLLVAAAVSLRRFAR